MTIRKLAKKTGVGVETPRFYGRIGIIFFFICFNAFAVKNCFEKFLALGLPDPVPFQEISERTPLPARDYPGFGYLWIYSGNYKGKKVFVKFPGRDAATISRNERLTQILADEGIGPEFLGVALNEKKQRGVITEFIAGIDLNINTKEIPASVSISMGTYRDVLKIRAKLEELDLTEAADLQIRVRTDGKAFLVDPELLKFRQEVPGGDGKALKQIDTVLATLKRILEKNNSWEN